MKIFSLATKRKIYNIVYKFLCIIFKQTSILLFYSSFSTSYTNINKIASCLNRRYVKYQRLDQESIQRFTIRSLILLSKAKVIVIDSSSPAAFLEITSKTKLINCWHACGAYKKIGFDAKRIGCNDIDEEKRISRIHRYISYFICSSEYVAKIYANAFRIPLEKVKPIGIPRTDKLITNIHKPPTKFSILYAPTFRTVEGKRIQIKPPPADDLVKELSQSILGEILLAFRKHPSCEIDELDGWEDWSDKPLDEALESTCILITDYSSIFFDFILLCRPIVFYIPDYNEYTYRERQLYFNPEDVFPNACCYDVNKLSQTIIKQFNSRVDYSHFIEKYMSSCDGNATNRVCDLIISTVSK